MSVASLFQLFESMDGAEAVAWRNETWTYSQLGRAADAWDERLAVAGVERGAAVALFADFSLQAIAALLALIRRGAIVVPIAAQEASRRQMLAGLACCNWSLSPEEAAREEPLRRLPGSGGHELYERLRATGHAGLVLFSSGSTGVPKAALHDMERIVKKFERPGRRFRTLAFLLFDHIGGVNTLFYTLANGGCLILAENRQPDAVLALVERHGAELLPTSPTFLNLMLLSGTHARHDLKSLRLVTYGTEPMPQKVLDALHHTLPHVQLQQTYGLSELGILRSRSRAPDSLWVRIGGPEFQTRVVDGVLQVKADSAMLGYLNAPSPFVDDVWFVTGDCVEQDGEYIRFLGRVADVINVGGEKVFPAEVENVICSADNVLDVLVYGRSNPLIGSVVAADVVLREPENPSAFRHRLGVWCSERLEAYKLPVEVRLVEAIANSERFKRSRRLHAEVVEET